MIRFKEFSYGASSAVITSLAIIVGLSSIINAKITILTALFIIAIADNISDSFGIHIYQESSTASAKDVKRTTTSNFIARIIVSAVFILFILFLPMTIAVILSAIFGLSVIATISYRIAKLQKEKSYKMIFRHLLLAIVVMIASFFLREIVANMMTKIV